jgi:hypothetical protein
MKLFSLEEANSLIPFLRQSLERIWTERNAIRQLTPKIRDAQDKALLGGGSIYGSLYVRHIILLQELANDIQSQGVIVKDFDIGLCDFPHDQNGNIVYLCWKPDEEHILWWHELDAGYAGRQRLD